MIFKTFECKPVSNIAGTETLHVNKHAGLNLPVYIQFCCEQVSVIVNIGLSELVHCFIGRWYDVISKIKETQRLQTLKPDKDALNVHRKPHCSEWQ
jgi:hypothetical protein